jgi:hypothetical protein
MHDFTTFQTQDEFHEHRRATIGSSDIPVLAGLFLRNGKTPYSLWEEKTGRREGFAGNEATWWGHVHEEAVLYRWVLDTYGEDAAYEFRQGRISNAQQVKRYDLTTGAALHDLWSYTQFQHPDYPWATCHPDLLDLTSHPHIQEAKSTGFFASVRSEDHIKGYDRADSFLGGVPLSVYLQVQWQLFVAGITPEEGTAGVSALIDTSDYRAYGPDTADPRTQEKLLALAERFWWHVQADTPPKPMTWEDVQRLWPIAEDSAAVYPLDFRFETEELETGALGEATLADLLAEREKVAARKKADAERLDEIRNAVGMLMGENRVLQTPEGQVIATRSDQTRESLSVSALGDHDPDLVERLREAGVIKETSFSKINFRKIKHA